MANGHPSFLSNYLRRHCDSVCTYAFEKKECEAMSLNLLAIYLALQTVPFISLLIALPYTVYGYLRSKSVNVWRCTYFYSFVLYFLCAYLMTILPLPSRESLNDMRPISELIQLIPFANFASIKQETLARDIAVIVFNVVLTIPLGFYLRALYDFNLKKTAVAGLCVALFYEISQLTGLFFIFPRPWRIFDIDDLMINTLGAVIGYVLTPAASRLLPGYAHLKTLRLSLGNEVSFRRRFLSGMIDMAVVLGLSTVLVGAGAYLLGGMIPDNWQIMHLGVFALILGVAACYSLLCGHVTLGNRLTGLRLTTDNGKIASRLQCAYRMILEHVCVTAIPFFVYFSIRISADGASIRNVLWLGLGTSLMLFAARNALEMMFNAVTHGSSMLYDRVTRTRLSYGFSKRSLFGIRVLDILPLEETNVDRLSETVCDTLYAVGFGREAITKVRLMMEGVLLEWMKAGLRGTPCELRLDKHFCQKALIISIPAANVDSGPAVPATEESYMDMLSKMTLCIESYRASQKNVCIIHIP